MKAENNEFDFFKAISYYTRCHGSIIHYIKVETNPNVYAHITIRKTFRGESPTVIDVLQKKKKDDLIESFGEF